MQNDPLESVDQSKDDVAAWSPPLTDASDIPEPDGTGEAVIPRPRTPWERVEEDGNACPGIMPFPQTPPFILISDFEPTDCPPCDAARLREGARELTERLKKDLLYKGEGVLRAESGSMSFGGGGGGTNLESVSLRGERQTTQLADSVNKDKKRSITHPAST